VERVWKGPAADTLTVLPSRPTKDETGQTWLIFAQSRYGNLQMDPCDSHPLPESDNMLRVLEQLPATGTAEVVDRALLDMFVAGLSDTSARVRAVSAWNLGFFDLYPDEVVPHLESAIDTDDPQVGIAAIRAMTSLHPRGDRTMRTFCRAYENPSLRVSAMEALSQYHYRQDVLHPLFLRAVRDTSVSVRRASLDFIDESDDSVAVLFPDFLRLLADPDAGVRESAVKKTRTFREAGLSIGPVLLDATRDQDPYVRSEAIRRLFHDAPANAEGVLRRALDDPAPEVRYEVLSLLARDEAPDRLREEAIDRGLGDSDPTVRAMAAELLFIGTATGSKHWERQVERAFADWTPDVWGYLQDGMCHSERGEGISLSLRAELLTRVITMAEQGVPMVRVCALRILDCWDAVPDHLALFDRALVSPHERVRWEAIRGLSRAGAAGAPALPRLRALSIGKTRQAESARRAIAAIEAAMIRP
jgi:HEAT repeat protein